MRGKKLRAGDTVTLDGRTVAIGQPSDEIGAQAMEILLQRIAGETGGEEQRRLPPSLIVCRSVRKL